MLLIAIDALVLFLGFIGGLFQGKRHCLLGSKSLAEYLIFNVLVDMVFIAFIAVYSPDTLLYLVEFVVLMELGNVHGRLSGQNDSRVHPSGILKWFMGKITPIPPKDISSL